MKKSITLLFFTLYCFTYGHAQIETFTVLNTGAFTYSPDCDLSLDGGLEGNFFFDVNTISGVIGDNWIIDNIMIDIAHQNVGDLFIAMSVPANDKNLLLALFDGGTGNNFSNTIFAPYATTPISDGVAPFSGVYLPRGNFSFLDGSDLNGFWRLKVCDSNDNDISGLVLGASITFRRKCPPPTNLVISNITNTTASASWSAGGSETSWEVRFQAPSIPAPTYTTPGAPTSTPSAGLNAIPPGVNADLYVRAVCGGGSFSDWVKTSFTTTNFCEPTSFESIEVVSTFFDGASFNWDTVVDPDWNIGLRNVTFGEPPFTNSYTVFDTYTVSANEYSINGLQQANDYELWLQPDCATGTNNHWQGPFLFTTGTLVVCQGASNLGASNITQTEATLTWTPGGSTPIDAWNLEIVDLTAGETLTGTPTVSNLTSPTYTATGLIPDHQYQYDVQAVCGSNSSGPFTFTTLAVGDCLDFTVYGTAGTWSNGVPDATTRAIFINSYSTSLGNITACKLIVTNGATLTINAGEFALIDNDITVEAGSKIEIAHQGSIVQVLDGATVTNDGTINVNVTTPLLKPRDFMIMGSPMTAETREGAFSAGYGMHKHSTANFTPHPDVATAFGIDAINWADDGNNNWSAHSGLITPGEGYLYRPQASPADGNSTYHLTYELGTLNNGLVTFPIVEGDNKEDSPNVMANPYASAIFLDAQFFTENPTVSEVYFWEHITARQDYPGVSTLFYSMDDISVYNQSGGMMATNGGALPNGYIATGQGFGVKANTGTGSSQVTFNNRLRRVGNNNTLRSEEIEKERLWLSITNTEYERTTSTLIAFNEEASEGQDNGYDSNKLATVTSLYSHHADGSGALAIQSRESFNEAITIPMGFSTAVEEEQEYTIAIDNLEGNSLSQVDIYLIDHIAGLTTALRDRRYTFTSTQGIFDNRFTLYFIDKNVLSTDTLSLDSITLFPNPTDGEFTVVKPSGLDLESLAVYDITGRLIIEEDLSTMSQTKMININALPGGTYICVFKGNGEELVKRIIKK